MFDSANKAPVDVQGRQTFFDQIHLPRQVAGADKELADAFLLYIPGGKTGPFFTGTDGADTMAPVPQAAKQIGVDPVGLQVLHPAQGQKENVQSFFLFHMDRYNSFRSGLRPVTGEITGLRQLRTERREFLTGLGVKDLFSDIKMS